MKNKANADESTRIAPNTENPLSMRSDNRGDHILKQEDESQLSKHCEDPSGINRSLIVTSPLSARMFCLTPIFVATCGVIPPTWESLDPVLQNEFLMQGRIEKEDFYVDDTAKVCLFICLIGFFLLSFCSFSSLLPSTSLSINVYFTGTTNTLSFFSEINRENFKFNHHKV